MNPADVNRLVFSLLSPALAPVPVVDIPPKGQAFPYVQIGRTIARNADLVTSLKERRIVYLSIWSDHRGQAECLELMSKIFDAVHRYSGPLVDGSGAETGRAVMITVREQTTTPEPDGLTFMGQVVLDILTEHA